jgi:CheY-like chemotaxis protein
VKRHGRAHYKAIVLDINMPIMDGIDACNKIHSYLTQECLICSMKIDPKRKSSEESKEPKVPVSGKNEVSVLKQNF